MTDEMKKYILSFEGLRLHSYQDSAGIWTIGYGTTRTEAGPVTEGMEITQEEATRLFEKQLAHFEKGVRELVKVPATENQISALTSFAYNVGLGALRNSSLLALFNAGRTQEAANVFLQYNKARVKGKLTELKGLTKRRTKEREVFLA